MIQARLGARERSASSMGLRHISSPESLCPRRPGRVRARHQRRGGPASHRIEDSDGSRLSRHDRPPVKTRPHDDPLSRKAVDRQDDPVLRRSQSRSLTRWSGEAAHAFSAGLSAIVGPRAAPLALLSAFSRISRNGFMTSMGIGKTTVEFCSAPISVSVCR